MKKTLFIIACAAVLFAAVSCGNKKSSAAVEDSYEILDMEQVDLSEFPVDEDGYTVIFDGTSTKGWRGYGQNRLPSKWGIEDGCLVFHGTGGGEAQEGDGGDIIFAHKFSNFEFELEYKVTKGANSGIFYLAQEVKSIHNGEEVLEPIYISAPEYQVLDNENHPDAKLGKDGNRKASSLYDMIPANPQNAKPYGEWNKAKIMVYQGTVVHYQNDENVLEYHLWTQKWTDMLQASKFSETDWPLAYKLLNNCGGDNHEGYIGFQDHGDVVYFRNIRIKQF